MNKLQIAVVSPETARKERSALLDKLVMAVSWLGKNWSLTGDPAQANIIVILICDSADGFSLWDKYRSKFPTERMVACSISDFPGDAYWHFYFKPGPKALSIAQIFNTLSHLAEPMLAPLVPSENFDPDDYLQGIITEALEDGISRICSISGVELYIQGKQKICYAMNGLEPLIPLFLAHRDNIAISLISDEELEQKVNFANFSSRMSKYAALAERLIELQEASVSQANQYSADELIWLATLVNSQGRRVSRCPFDDFNRIVRWPEFIQSQLYLDYLPTLKHNAIPGLNVREFAEKTRATKRQMIDLHNACAILGMAACENLSRTGPEFYRLAQKEIYRVFKPRSAKTAGRLKIIISGPVGAGKSTAIRTLERCSPISLNTHKSEDGNQSKTGSDDLDHGEIRFNDLLIHLYSTPDQRRYSFIGDILCKNATGLLLLVGNMGRDPIGELDFYLSCFQPHLPGLRVVIGVTFYERNKNPGLDQYRSYLDKRGLDYVVAPVNPEIPMDMARLLSYLADK